MVQPTLNVLDAAGLPVTVNTINPAGRVGAVDSQPSVLATEDKSVFDAIASSLVSIDAKATALGNKKPWHGVVARPVGAANPLPTTITTTTFTLSATANPISYYFNGTLDALHCRLDVHHHTFLQAM